jgi:hypothetical protein
MSTYRARRIAVIRLAHPHGRPPGLRTVVRDDAYAEGQGAVVARAEASSARQHDPPGCASWYVTTGQQRRGGGLNGRRNGCADVT